MFVKAKILSLRHDRIRWAIVRIRAKVADATELVQSAKEQVTQAENALVQAQLHLEELYFIIQNLPVFAGAQENGNAKE
ncbi:MAG: hypothetical protein PHO66_08565 [Eubacteriales bacterium]|nr:hypothetical protein [Eubacteriales bacterium]